jgi:hypothetical protein
MSTRRAWAAFVLAALARTTAAQAPQGSEFRVNSYTTSSQQRPSAAYDGTGNFVVVWDSVGEDGDGYGVFAQSYDGAGNPILGEFQVNATGTGRQARARIAPIGGGAMLVVWSSDSVDGSGQGIVGRGVHPLAGAVTSELQVNTYTSLDQYSPSIAADANGNFVVVWQSQAQDGSGWGVFGRRFTSAGAPAGLEFQVNSTTMNDQTHPDVAVDASGNFVVAWQSLDAFGYGVFAQRYDSAGARVGGEFQVNTYTPYSQQEPSVAAAPDGSFFVVWEDYLENYPEYHFSVRGRRYDAAGAPQGSDFSVNTYTTGWGRQPRISADGTGQFSVVWQAVGNPTEPWDVRGRRYDALGVAGAEFRLNTWTTDNQLAPAVAAAPNGHFVAMWGSFGQDGESMGVFAQRFAPDPDLIFRDDFEAGNLSAWSAASIDGGNLRATAASAMKATTVGLRGLVNDTSALYVEDDSPGDEAHYRARFYIDPNGFDPGESQAHLRTRTFIAFSEAPPRRLSAVVLKRQGGSFSLMGRVRLDDNTQVDTGFFPISDSPHAVEIELRKASSPAAFDGYFEMKVDGLTVGALGGLDNSRDAVDFVRLGALSLKPGATGTLFWDEFESRRANPIGP